MAETRRAARRKVKETALFLFELFKDAMRGQHLLEKAGFKVKAGAPPEDIRTGCDLALGVDIGNLPAAQKVLQENKVDIMDVALISKVELAPLQMTKLVKETDFGDHLMVRCGNMKLTFDKKTGTVVNISGGGCPDIPNLVLKIVGTKLGEGPSPRSIGFTLCAYTLDQAYDRAIELWRGK